MDMFRRIFFAAVLAGVVAGLALSAIQQWRVVPLILQAEHFENDLAHAEGAATSQPHTDEPSDGSGPWAPGNGFERTFYTVLATMLVSVGFALVIGAVSVLLSMEITLANGAIWGLGGFLAFSLAPAFGLPPVLPGMELGDLGDRQFWWWGTALATGGGLLAMAKFRSVFALALGLLLIIAPHIIGAPSTPDMQSQLPAHLAAAFTASTLTASMVYWLIAGSLIGLFNQRFTKGAA